jgi:hypothetical protein
MSIELMTKAFKARVGNQTRKLVLIKLADNADDKGRCFPSYQSIADACEVSRQSVITHVKAMQELGLLSIQKRFVDGENSSNIFTISIKKLDEMGSQGALPPSQGALPPSQGALPPSQGALPPLVNHVDPESSIFNHQLTINEPSTKEEREEIAVLTESENDVVPVSRHAENKKSNITPLTTTNRIRQTDAPKEIVSPLARSLTATLHNDTAKRVKGFNRKATAWADETAIAELLANGVTESDIKQVWEFSTSKPFWAGKIATPKDLARHWVALSQEASATSKQQQAPASQYTKQSTLKNGKPVMDKDAYKAADGEGWYAPWGTREGWHDGVFYFNDCEMLGHNSQAVAA